GLASRRLVHDEGARLQARSCRRRRIAPARRALRTRRARGAIGGNRSRGAAAARLCPRDRLPLTTPVDQVKRPQCLAPRAGLAWKQESNESSPTSNAETPARSSFTRP